MQLRYNFRVYPRPGQRIALAKAFGCARAVYNDALATRLKAYGQGLPFVTDAELSKRLTEVKKTPARAWLTEVSAVVLQQALADLNTAYRNFFQSAFGERKGGRVGTPRFRSRKDNRQSIRFTANARFKITAAGKLRLPKVGDVKVAWSRELPTEPSSVTIVKDSAGRYFASFVVEVVSGPLPGVEAEVGIDLGLTTFAVLSNGKTIASPRFLRQAERRLRKAQKALSRKEKGSANRVKARLRVAKAHAKVADTRRDWAHKQSTMIIRENQAVFVEDLCVKGLARTWLAKSVHDAGWGMFTQMLEEKAARYGRHFGKVDRFFPSTRMCSGCGAIGEKKPLHVREWTCPCGARHDRDMNAAKNILAVGRADRPTPVELVSVAPSGTQPAVKQEPAGTTAVSDGDRISAVRSVEDVNVRIVDSNGEFSAAPDAGKTGGHMNGRPLPEPSDHLTTGPADILAAALGDLSADGLCNPLVGESVGGREPGAYRRRGRRVYQPIGDRT